MFKASKENAIIKIREFEVGRKVFLLLPSEGTKLLARWQGLNEVIMKVSTVDYEIYMPDKQKKI